MAAAAVMRPSSHGSGRQAVNIGVALPRRPSQNRTRNPSRTSSSGLARTAVGRVASVTAPSCTGSTAARAAASTNVPARPPSMPGQLGSTRSSAPWRSSGAAEAGASRGARPQPSDRRKNPSSIMAGMMMASSSKSLGNCSDGSGSPRGSNAGSTSDACQETSEAPSVVRHGSAPAAPSKTSTHRIPVPSGVEEDFEPHNWLSDASIAFASSHLARSGCSSAPSGKRLAFPKSVMVMDPAMAFWMIMQGDSQCLDEAKKEMKLPELELLLCPINDTQNACTADTGCHWSLLVCWCDGLGGSRRHKGTGDTRCALTNFRYYDSLGEMFIEKGISQAEQLATRLVGKPVDIEIGKCAQQTNFYDCGVYVLLFCEIIARAYEDFRKHSPARSGAVSPLVWEEQLAAITPEEVDACRSHYHQLAREGSQH